jgi:hypothetical protein
MARKERAVDSVAEAYLTLLAERGVEYLFANSGTDFAPLIEVLPRPRGPAPGCRNRFSLRTKTWRCRWRMVGQW